MDNNIVGKTLKICNHILTLRYATKWRVYLCFSFVMVIHTSSFVNWHYISYLKSIMISGKCHIQICCNGNLIIKPCCSCFWTLNDAIINVSKVSYQEPSGTHKSFCILHAQGWIPKIQTSILMPEHIWVKHWWLLQTYSSDEIRANF